MNIDNFSEYRIDASARVFSPVEDMDNIAGIGTSYFYNLAVFSDTEKTVVLKAFLPEDAPQQKLVVSVTLEYADEIATFERELIVNR